MGSSPKKTFFYWVRWGSSLLFLLLYFFTAPFDTLAKASTQGAIKKITSALGCFGFSTEVSRVFLEVVEKSLTK